VGRRELALVLVVPLELDSFIVGSDEAKSDERAVHDYSYAAEQDEALEEVPHSSLLGFIFMASARPDCAAAPDLLTRGYDRAKRNNCD
jgi:hypothetical protein